MRHISLPCLFLFNFFKIFFMRSISLIPIVILAITANNLFAQGEKTDTIKVYGNCSMCKNRIENTVKADVSYASWSPETKLLIVRYDPTKISNDSIQKSIAAVGHDTDKYLADDKVYSKLPGCCLYQRKKGKENENNTSQH